MFSTMAMVLGLTACGPSPENDPIYLLLKANAPTSIPARHLPKLRQGFSSAKSSMKAARTST